MGSGSGQDQEFPCRVVVVVVVVVVRFLKNHQTSSTTNLTTSQILGKLYF